jgi:hypothetical protein
MSPGRDLGEPGREGLEGGLLGGLAGGGQRGQGAAVEGVVEGHDAVAVGPVVGLPVASGQLDGRLVGGGPAVGEEDPVEPGASGEGLGKFDHRLGVEEVRHVHQSAHLVVDGGGDRRVGVADRGDGESGEKVQVALACLVDQPRALPRHEGDRRTPVGLHHYRRLAIEQRGHGVRPFRGPQTAETAVGNPGFQASETAVGNPGFGTLPPLVMG